MNDAYYNFLKQKAEEFVLAENLKQEKSERFEVFCVIYDAFPEIEKRIFEDFKNILISKIKKIDEKLHIKYSEDKNEAFWIYKDTWKIKLPQKIDEIEEPEKWGFYYYIMNSVDWDGNEVGLGLGNQEIGFDSKHQKGASKIFEKLLQNSKFCSIVEDIHNLLKDKVDLNEDNRKSLKYWQKDFKVLGCIFIVYMNEPATGWDPTFQNEKQRLKRRSFYLEFLKAPGEMVDKYINKFEKVYELTNNKIEELVETCNAIYG